MTLLQRLSYIFFPAKCCVCDKALSPGADICENCRKLILHYPAQKASCDRCGLGYDRCSCGKRLLYTKLTTPFLYEGNVQRSLLKMKFSGRLDVIRPFAARIADALSERELLNGTDIITYIPMHRRAEFKRGYNQSKLLAEELGRQTGIPVMPLLCKPMPTPQQHSLNLSRRSGNLIGMFEPIKEAIPLAEGKNILIVDDIVTTGSTLNEAAKTLLIFGAENVNVCAAAQGIYRRRVKNAQK